MARNRKKLPLREYERVPRAGWSKWKTAMIPEEKKARNKLCHDGYYLEEMETAFKKKDSGIYEWKAVSPKGDEYVVYIGSTHRRKTPSDLRDRIMEYCLNGSHEPVAEVMNKVLRYGYELHVRVKGIKGTKIDAEEEENKLLQTYNYAWNTRDNGKYRGDKVPPCPP